MSVNPGVYFIELELDTFSIFHTCTVFLPFLNTVMSSIFRFKLCGDLLGFAVCVPGCRGYPGPNQHRGGAVRLKLSDVLTDPGHHQCSRVHETSPQRLCGVCG